MECGAAALGIIMAYYGRHVPLERLRIDCGVSRDGSHATNILKAAKRYNLDGKAVKIDINKLQQLPPPYIVFWKMNHFIVVEGFKKDLVYVNDPAFGRQALTAEEFSNGYTGIVIALFPNEAFKPCGKTLSSLGSIWSRLGQNRKALAYLFLVGLCLVLPGLLIPIFAKTFVDSVIVMNVTGWIKPLLLGMLLTAIFRIALFWVQNYYFLRMEMKLSIYNESKFLWHLMQLPTLFFGQRFAGDLAYRVQLNDSVASILTRRVTRAFINIVMIVFYLLLMLYYDVFITLIVTAIAAVNFGLLKYLSRIRRENSQKLINEQTKLMGTAMNGIKMIENIKATGGEHDFFVKWSGLQTKMMNISQQLNASTTYVTIVPSILNIITTAVILGIGGYAIINGGLTIGMLVALQTLAASFLKPISELVAISSEIQEVHGDISKLDDVMNYQPDTLYIPKDEKKGHESVMGMIELKNITFGYNPNAPPVIKNFSMKVKPGERIAVVGRSGSGKSTITHLILGMYQPWEGEILLDGKPLTDYDREKITTSIGMVEQNHHLFEGTVMENVTMWDKTISEYDITRACKDAEIHNEITSRRGSYYSDVESNGKNFSGGERQRLEIARTLVRNPKVLVFDEATSALDPLTETKIDHAVRRRGCSTIMVAHRLSTIRDSDEIIVLENGEIKERGTHDELIAHKGTYHQLISTE